MMRWWQRRRAPLIPSTTALLIDCTLSLQAIKVFFFFLLPFATARLQPLDMGIIQNFKVNYHRRIIKRLLILIVIRQNKILKIDLWMAFQMLKVGWMDVTCKTMQNCFRKAGFVSPLASQASVEDAVLPNAREYVWQAREDALKARLASNTDNLDDFLVASIAVWVTEELDDNAFICEV